MGWKAPKIQTRANVDARGETVGLRPGSLPSCSGARTAPWRVQGDVAVGLCDTLTSIFGDHRSQQTHGWAKDGPVCTVSRVWGQRAGQGTKPRKEGQEQCLESCP